MDKKYVRYFGREFNFRRLWTTCVLILAAALFGVTAICASQNGSVADSSGSVQDVNVQHKDFSIQKKDSLITLNAQDADISEILKEIENVSGVKITIDQRILGKKISAKAENKDVEGVLREVLKGQYYVLDYSQEPTDKTKRILKEVKVKGDVIGTKPLKGQLIKVEIPYGHGKGEVRAVAGPEGSSDGPPSYAVDNKNNIYILDRLNNRVQVYSSTGKYLSTIRLRDNVDRDDKEMQSITHLPIDIVVDSFGYFYVYDSEDKIYQYDMKGNIISYINVNNRSWTNQMGPMKIVNNELFMDIDLCDSKRMCGNAILGRIGTDKRLVNPTSEEARKPWEERKLPSGKIYKGNQYIEGYNRELNILDGTGIPIKTISIPSERILTRELLGEDKKGNFFFQIRTVENEDRLYNIDEFNPAGEYLGTAQIPGGTYYNFPAAKDFIVNENGNIYNYIPEKNSLKIFIFLNQGNQ
jgi:hypothetical protein